MTHPPHPQQESSRADEASPVRGAPLSDTVLSVCGNPVALRDGVWHMHHSFGRVVELLAPHVRAIHYHAPQAGEIYARNCDYPLPTENMQVHPWPVWKNTLHALKRPDLLIRSYWRMAARGDALFLRGSGPLLWTAHLMARLRGRPVVHWIVGNPLALMRAERRGFGTVVHRLGILFAWCEQHMMRLAMRISKATMLVNGAELAGIYRSRRTIPVVSTSITGDDFLVRTDTCQGAEIRVLFVGFVRPEKGLEFLLRALPTVKGEREVQLAIVGSWAGYEGEYRRLCALADELGVTERVTWEGYAEFGRELFDQMDRSDLLVLPSLSEGTPRVLVEARARSLPIISTTVGGIPSSVTDGLDGLLIPPREAQALAGAMERIIHDGDLRRQLIANGRETVREWTVERFVERVCDALRGQMGDRHG